MRELKAFQDGKVKVEFEQKLNLDPNFVTDILQKYMPEFHREYIANCEDDPLQQGFNLSINVNVDDDLLDLDTDSDCWSACDDDDLCIEEYVVYSNGRQEDTTCDMKHEPYHRGYMRRFLLHRHSHRCMNGETTRCSLDEGNGINSDPKI